MKTNTTPEKEKQIADSIRHLAKLFDCQSCDPKYNAQRNLDGRTHFVDDATLKWHKSRVLGSRSFAGGLLFKLTTSDALDMRNTQRGIRVHVFDVFGSHVWGQDLQNACKRREQADKLFENAEFDLVAHYKAALASKIEWLKKDAEEIEKAIQAI